MYRAGLSRRSAKAWKLLEWAPFTCRKIEEGPFLRELVIPFGIAGYVRLYEIIDDSLVRVAAVRHQLEDDDFD